MGKTATHRKVLVMEEATSSPRRTRRRLVVGVGLTGLALTASSVAVACTAIVGLMTVTAQSGATGVSTSAGTCMPHKAVSVPGLVVNTNATATLLVNMKPAGVCATWPSTNPARPLPFNGADPTTGDGGTSTSLSSQLPKSWSGVNASSLAYSLMFYGGDSYHEYGLLQPKDGMVEQYGTPNCLHRDPQVFPSTAVVLENGTLHVNEQGIFVDGDASSTDSDLVTITAPALANSAGRTGALCIANDEQATTLDNGNAYVVDEALWGNSVPISVI